MRSRRPARALRTARCVIVVLAACTSAEDAVAPGAVRGDEPLQTDQLAYTAVSNTSGPYAQYTFRLVATYTNRTSGTVYLARCYPTSPTPLYGVTIVGDSTGANGWGSIFNRVWGCVGHSSQFPVAPGATRTDTLEISGPNAWKDGVPLGKFGGRLRIGYGVGACVGEIPCMASPLPGYSNEFDVTVVR
jgi:hypothetical protein